MQNGDKFTLDQKQTSNAVHNAYHIGRFCEISNDITPQYERVWFGSLKTSWGVINFLNTVHKTSDIIFKITSDDSFIYYLQFAEQINKYKNMRNVYSVHNKINNLSNTNIHKYIDNINNKYFSSAIVQSQYSNNKEENLFIISTGIASIDKNFLATVNQLNQPNFKENLEFAKKYKLLDEEEIILMEGGIMPI